ncbi:MAG: histidinol dehydrogenase [Proteobacteria bacterium]|nr:histidinol dehydrogenase [Pseudomonadota bacterium]
MKILKIKKRDIEKYVKDKAFRIGFGSEFDLTVKKIIKKVMKEGDTAISHFTKKFDGIDLKPDKFELNEKEWELGIKSLDKKIKEVIDLTIERLENFYKKTIYNSWFHYDEFGNLLGVKISPLKKILVYAPGGKAIYPSSVLMGAIPAKIAGVEEIILTSPSKDGKISPAVLYSARKAGVKKVYRLGGAQAIAGFAFGTKNLPKVDKIVGPGNIYVATAKKLLFGIVDIDMVAGPSEVFIIFDETTNLKHIALDMLSQLEHDEQALAIAVTNSKKSGERLQDILIEEAKKSERYNIIEKSLKNSAILVVDNLLEAVSIANEIAPEHLEICTNDPYSLLPYIINAGAIFLGNNTPEAVGDYMAGPNHILPTGGTARFFSPLGVEDFIKRTSIISFTEKGLNTLGKKVASFARYEGLFAHAKSVEERLKGKK